MTVLRIVPMGSYAGRARAVIERSALVNRRNWLLVVSGVFEPLFYLFALGIGFGGIVGNLTGPDGSPISYAAYVAPGLLAASAMNGAIHDSTFNIFLKLKYAKVYDAMLATPLGPTDVALGETSWSLIRGGIYAAGFLAVMAVLGLISSPWALLALPAALLVAFGFAAVGMGAATLMRSWQDFDLILLVQMPMFLFSTTFFPIGVYPEPIRIAVECFPLYHGIELMRALTSGAVTWGILGHVAYFAIMVALGGWFAARRLGTLLLT